MNTNDLVTIDDVRHSLVEVEERLALFRSELGELASTEDDGLAAQLDVFDLLPGKLRPVMIGKHKTEAQRLEEQLTRSASLASSASYKVKELDVVRERVREASARVEAALEAGRCAEGVKQALAQQDLESAAKFIGRHRSLKQEVSPDMQAAALQVEKSLSAQLQSAEAAALNSSDPLVVGEVVRVASLLSAVGGEREAKTSYCGWVRKRVENASRTRRLQCEKELENAVGDVKKLAMCATALSELFENAAGEMTKRLPEAIEALGAGMAVSVAHAIEDGVGLDGARVIEVYRKIANLAVTRAGPLTGSVGSSSGGAGSRCVLSKAEEAALTHLDSVALICSRIFLWKRFCDSKLAGKESRDNESFNSDSTGGRKLLESQVNEVVAEYVGLEERFLLSSVQKAIEMDEPDPDSLTGKMVDYVFFVLQKGAHRSISTLAGDGACAVLNIVNSCLDSFLGVQQQLLANAASRPMLIEPSTTSGSAARVPYAVALNSVALSAEFIVRLRNELEAAIKKYFAGNLREIAKVEMIFGELTESAGHFRNAVTTNLKQVAQTLDPSIRDMADQMNASNYVMTEKDYSSRQIDEDANWPLRLVRQLESLVSPFRRSMLPVCWESLSKSIALALVARLERGVVAKKYNALGALQLSRDIAHVTQVVIAMCPQARGDVSRLNQMCVTLSAETCSDVQELAAGPQWRLTPGETRRLLARRVEFKPEDIERVQL